jgi:hypothetical protein
MADYHALIAGATKMYNHNSGNMKNIFMESLDECKPEKRQRGLQMLFSVQRGQ